MTPIGKPNKERVIQPDVIIVRPPNVPVVSPRREPAPVRAPDRETVPA